MWGKTKKDRIRNKYIQKKSRIARIRNKLGENLFFFDQLRENRLKWFRHIYGRSTKVLVRKKINL